MRKLCLLLGLLLATAYGQEHKARLSWEQNSCISETVGMDRVEPFAKEPPLSGGKVLRGVLSWGYADSRTSAGLLWDVDVRKLFIDLNADGDLTNDGDPLVSDEGSSYYQSFPEFEVSFTSAEGTRSFKLAPRFVNADWSRQGQFSIASAYAGDIDLHGQTCHLKVWDDLDKPLTDPRYFLIAQKDKDGNAESPGYFSTPRSVFVGDRCYDLALTPSPQADGRAGLTCTLTERDVPTGTLAIKGQWVHRLALEDKSPPADGRGILNMIVIPQLSADSATVPAGTYSVEKFTLQPGGDKPAFSPMSWGWEKSVTVTEGQTAELAIGGPLKQTVDVSRTGSTLTFSYALTGAGGEPYDLRQLHNFDYNKKPSVAIYKGDMQLATGSFEYG